MRRLFDTLFYCLYRVFRLINRVDEKDESRAANFYSLLLSTNTLTASLFLKFAFPQGYFATMVPKYFFMFMVATVFIGWYLVCRNYFSEWLLLSHDYQSLQFTPAYWV